MGLHKNQRQKNKKEGFFLIRDNIILGCTEPTLNVVLSLLHRTMRHQCKQTKGSSG